MHLFVLPNVFFSVYGVMWTVPMFWTSAALNAAIGKR